jgi:hypothetical protein
MLLDSSGNLGIGTSSPAYRLDVAWDDASTTRARLKNASSNSAAVTLLQIANNLDNSLQIGQRSSAAADANESFIQNNTGGLLTLSTLGSTAIRFITNSSEKMRLDASGNLGIGTSSPSFKLQVAGTQRIQKDGAGYEAAMLSFSTISETGAIYRLGMATGGNFTIGRSDTSTTNITLDSSGNLGIGTSSPGEKLNVLGGGATSSTVNFTGGAAGNDNATIASDYSLCFQVDANNNIGSREFAWRVGGKGYSDGTSLMTLNSSGNLGLGVTPTGTSKFEVYTGTGAFNGITARFDAANSPISLSVANSNGFPYLGFNTVQVSGTDDQTYGTTNFASRLDGANGGFRFFTAPSGTAGNAISFTQALTLDANRNLALNTTSVGTSAAGVLSVGSGTEPSSGPADTVQFYSVDRSAGNTIPAIYCEGSGVTNAGITNVTVTNKIAIKINGTVYYLLATTNAT